MAVIRERLAAFARETASDLPLYRAICEGAVDDEEVASLLCAAAPGQARPVLLLAALHDLVLRRPDVPASSWFALAAERRLGGRPGAGDPWPDVRATFLAHADELRAVIASRSTQTNEVNRAAYVAALLTGAAADVPDAPVALVEQGCAAGLLLAVDRYRIELGNDAVLGDPGSPVRCHADLRAARGATGPAGSAVSSVSASSVTPPAGALDLALPSIVERVGLDRTPVALDDADEIRWLEACLWPDQPERLARLQAAVALVRADPPVVGAGDMVDDLGATAHAARAVATALVGPGGPPVHLVVFSSWALTYVRRDRRTLVADTLAELAADGRPVTWATAEPPGAVPGVPAPADSPDGGETTLALRRWRAAAELPPTVVGTAHPHAAWLDLHRA